MLQKKKKSKEPKRKGCIIDFEGLDHSFKETNTKKLVEYIKENITDKVELISFPNYESESSIFVKNYLNGKYGDASTVDPYQASVMFAMDRYDTMKEKEVERKLKEGYIIILDRYTGSNKIFQTSKTSVISNKWWYNSKELLDWIDDFEYNKLKLPKEDLVIYMDMPVNVSYSLMKERALKAGTEVDGHESNYKFMKTVEKVAHSIIIPRYKYNVISCIDVTETYNIKIRKEDEIFKDIVECVNNFLQQKHNNVY